MKKQIDVSRKNQLHRKREIQSAKQREDTEFGEFWKLRNQELQVAEAQEKEEEKQRQLEINNYLQNQIDQKNRAAKEEYLTSL